MALEKTDNHVIPGLICLRGRIFKVDKFVRSKYTDQESLNEAVRWYRKGFKVHPNKHASINLATFLVVAGHTFF